MARRKREEGGHNNAAWMNTFADLMNLLLCFFVMLFAMSDVDAAKFDSISISMANSFGVFEGGGSSVGTGNLISSGMTQMNDLGEYYTSMGKSNKETGSDIEAENNASEREETNEGQSGSQNGNGDAELAEAQERLLEKMAQVSSGMYDEVSDLAEKYNLGNYVELSMDPEYQFIGLTLKGSVLFDSGKADIKEAAKPILLKIGNILKKFEGYTVEITGHTDNVPMYSEAFRNNNWLSSARALNAVEFLIDNCELDPTNIKYSGRGEYEPIASNATAEGRAKNRRIEIKIYNEYSGK